MNVGRTIDPAVARVPERIALVVGDQQISYRELEQWVRRVAAALTARGVGRGQRVALLDNGSVLSVATILAAARVGASSAQMNVQLTAPELRTLTDAVGARVGVAGPSFRAGLADAIGAAVVLGDGRRRRARRAEGHPIYGRGPRGRRRRGAGVVHQRHDGPAEADLHQPRGGVPAPEVLRLGRRPGRPAGDRHDVGPDLPHRRHAGAADQLACRPQAGRPAPLRCRVVAARRRGAPGVPDVRRTHDAPAHPGPSRLPVAGPQLPATAQLRRGGCAGRPGGTSPRRPAARRVRERLRPDGDPRGVRRPHGRGPPRPPQAGLGGQGAAGRRAADRRPRGRRGLCRRSGRRGVGPRRAERQPRLAAHG